MRGLYLLMIFAQKTWKKKEYNCIFFFKFYLFHCLKENLFCINFITSLLACTQ